MIMGQKQKSMAYDCAQEKRRGGLASPIKQSGGSLTHIKVGNSVHNEVPPKGEISVGNSPHPTFGKKC
jgi:hypothetical protein